MDETTDMSAFPDSGSHIDRNYAPSPGMSLLDYFAAKAMQGLCASDAYSGDKPEDIARYAYAQAKTMMEVRKVTPTPERTGK